MDIDRKNQITSRVNSAILAEVGEKTVLSIRELWKSCVGYDKPINWIKSYKTLLKYVTNDYRNIFEPVEKGKVSGTRYYVKVEKVIDFVYKFETGQL